MTNSFQPASDAKPPQLDLTLALRPGHGGDDPVRFDANAIALAARTAPPSQVVRARIILDD
ncbi:hypothetical protein B7R21_11630 [Subtercola boreus]|uniref:Uncharacterized protein n=1 Tax=Subtercola boreus TaxID=120213 RepID=A0A3E0VSW9_9MICO|nr:hypothetical protein [Subtercola boreus]RFA11977.1 hypothetical protein B7R21_11630 [Subtercola boreus]